MNNEHCRAVHVFTDGACSGNPGPGGWGAVLRYGGTEKELSGFEAQTTNNRMELTAVIRAFEALTRPCRVTVVSDSNYVVRGMKEWIHSWRKNGWRTASKKPVENQDLWQRLVDLAARHRVDWQWVRGHRGHPENERADALARDAIREGGKKRRADFPDRE